MAIDIKITSDDTIEHDGKQYKPMAIRFPKKGERYLDVSCGVCIAGHGFSERVHVILHEVIPPYRTPTDEDAKQRPMAEFWDGKDMPSKPHQGVLLAVSCGRFPFVTGVSAGVSCWQHCRIPNEGATK